ncbi:heptosyltransferase-2 [Ensifer adhaerens]|nr:heptosyltransferase-2 [Ensifer adhaerens]
MVELRQMSNSADILIIGPSWIGDMVMAQALFKALKLSAPQSAIDVTAPAWALGVLARMPEVRNAIAMPFDHGEARLADRWRFGRSLKGRYRSAYILPGSWKSALVPFAAGISERVGYLKEQRWGLLNRIVGLPAEQKKKTMATYQALADKRVFEDQARLLMPSLSIDQNNQKALLARFELSRGGFAILVPGAEFGPAKRWPARHFASLANDFMREGTKVVLVGSKKDSAAAMEIQALAPDAIDLTGLTSIIDVVDLAAAARCVVANDSGLLHVAAAVGVPVVGVYGSTSARHTPPQSVRATTVSLNLPCSPCGKRTCPLGHLDCLEKLEPPLVAQALQNLEKQVLPAD